MKRHYQTCTFLLLLAIAIQSFAQPSNSTATNSAKRELTDEKVGIVAPAKTWTPPASDEIIAPAHATNPYDDLPDAQPTPQKPNPFDIAEKNLQNENFRTISLRIVFLVISLMALIACVILARQFVRRSGAPKFIFLCGILAFVLCGLFPPWLDISHQGHTRAAAYSFILSPPATAPYSYGVTIDFGRLAIEWLCILAVTAVAWIIFVAKIKSPAKD